MYSFSSIKPILHISLKSNGLHYMGLWGRYFAKLLFEYQLLQHPTLHISLESGVSYLRGFERGCAPDLNMKIYIRLFQNHAHSMDKLFWGHIWIHDLCVSPLAFKNWDLTDWPCICGNHFNESDNRQLFLFIYFLFFK